MKEYTQEMRINQEPCPYCGFWHSALSHPPQFAGYVLEIQRLERIEKAARELKDKMQAIQDSPEYFAVFSFWKTHFGNYKGDSWEMEFIALAHSLRAKP